MLGQFRGVKVLIKQLETCVLGLSVDVLPLETGSRSDSALKCLSGEWCSRCGINLTANMLNSAVSGMSIYSFRFLTSTFTNSSSFWRH